MPLLPTFTTKLAGKITEAILKLSTNNIQTPSSEGKKNKNKKESITTQLIAAAKPIAVELLGGKGKGKEESSHGAGGGIGAGAGGGHGGGVYMSGGCGGRLSAASESVRGGEGGGGSNASYYGGYESRSRDCGGREVHGIRARRESRDRHGGSDSRSDNGGDLGDGEEEVGDYAQEGWFDE